MCATVTLAVLSEVAPATAGPLLVDAPELTRLGRTLYTSNGSWLPSGNSYTYRWERCGAGGCAVVPGRTASSYLLTTADIGRRIRSIVTASNGALGPSSAPSDATDPIVASPPLNMVPPVVTGNGPTLTSTLGTWSDPSPASLSYTRRWQRCSGGSGLTCEDVAGQSGATYALSAADADKFIRVVVSAEGLGARSVASAPFGPIPAPPAPGGGPGGGSGGDPGGGSGTGPGSTGSTPPPVTPRKLRPFPKVVVAGRVARGLTFISALVVRSGPSGAGVSVRCRGRGCPKGAFRGKLNRRGALRLKRFQRIYGPGTTIEIRVTRRGAIGKFTRLKVRRRSVPSRRDACLMPGARKLSRCP